MTPLEYLAALLEELREMERIAIGEGSVDLAVNCAEALLLTERIRAALAAPEADHPEIPS